MRLAWSTLLPAAACTYYFTRFLKKISFLGTGHLSIADEIRKMGLQEVCSW